MRVNRNAQRRQLLLLSAVATQVLSGTMAADAQPADCTELKDFVRQAKCVVEIAVKQAEREETRRAKQVSRADVRYKECRLDTGKDLACSGFYTIPNCCSEGPGVLKYSFVCTADRSATVVSCKFDDGTE
ncbi:MAG: hypothetical protein QOJ84_2670 [Bradyrhizobium sp.]|jgi:hypothetical protein|nr:hypothetical protein [Bradyrhizobium sp.]